MGLALFVVSLVVVPLIDVFYVKGRVGLYPGFYVTAGAVALSGVADALVQGSIVGSAGELPERYMQAVVAGTAASGIVLSLLNANAIIPPPPRTHFVAIFGFVFYFYLFFSFWGFVILCKD